MIFVAVIIFTLIIANGAFIGSYQARGDTIRSNEKKIKALQSALDNQTKPICLCNHGINFHHNGKCAAVIDQEDVWPFHNVVRDKKCTCKKYVGPEPLPTYYHPLELT